MTELEGMTIEELLGRHTCTPVGFLQVDRNTKAEQEILSRFAKLEAINKGHQHAIDGYGHLLKAYECEIVGLKRRIVNLVKLAAK